MPAPCLLFSQALVPTPGAALSAPHIRASEEGFSWWTPLPPITKATRPACNPSTTPRKPRSRVRRSPPAPAPLNPNLPTRTLPSRSPPIHTPPSQPPSRRRSPRLLSLAPRALRPICKTVSFPGSPSTSASWISRPTRPSPCLSASNSSPSGAPT